MIYKLLYTQTSVKDIKKLDPVTKKRLKKKLELYEKNPLTYAKRLTDSTLGTYHFRIGDYRVTFDMDKNNIVVLRIRHRREIYKR